MLLQICGVSTEFARPPIAIFIAVSAAGISAPPFLTIITDLISGVGERKTVIKLVKENNEIFVEANVK